MTNQMTSGGNKNSFIFQNKITFILILYIETSFWLKFLHNSDLSIDNNTLLRYNTILTNRFTTIEELLAVDENELINLGITNQLDRSCLIKQARLLDDKVNN
jgi:hypothetical protein